MPDEIPGRVRPPPPPVRINQNEEYEVEEILDAKWNSRTKRLRFLVRWKGYGPTEDSWETENDLENAKEALKDYKRARNLPATDISQ